MKHLLTALFAVLVVTACGGGEKEEVSETADTKAAPTTTAPAVEATTTTFALSEEEEAYMDDLREQLDEIIGPVSEEASTIRPAPEIERFYAESLGLDPDRPIESVRESCTDTMAWSCHYDGLRREGLVTLNVVLTTPGGWTDVQREYLGCVAAYQTLDAVGYVAFPEIKVARPTVDRQDGFLVYPYDTIEEACPEP
jgi:hypothetical protein